MYIIDNNFWLIVGLCWITVNRGWQQESPFVGAVSAVMNYLGFSRCGRSALPRGPTTMWSTNLPSRWAFKYSGMSPTCARPIISCYSVLRLWCSSPDCVWIHLKDAGLNEVTLCCHCFISIVVWNKKQPLWKVKRGCRRCRNLCWLKGQ